MRLGIQRYIYGRIIVISTLAFILVAVLLVINHLLVVPRLVSHTEPVATDWICIGIDVYLVLIIGAFVVYWITRLYTERQHLEEMYHVLVASLPVGVYIIQDGRFVYVNQRFQGVTGYTEAELLDMDPIRMVHPEDREMVRNNAVAMLNKERQTSYEFKAATKKGDTVWAMETVNAIQYNDRRAVLGNIVDVTELKQVEGKLKQAASEWRTTFDSITDWVSIHDKEHKITRVNMACAGGFDLRPEEMIGKTCYEVYHGTGAPVSNCPHLITMKTGRPATEEFFLASKGIYMEITTSPVFNDNGQITSTVHVARDITERKKMEEQLIIADRLASIGELASGIAHELNNPLTSVIGFSQLVLQEDIPDNIRRDLDVVNSEAQRTAEVVKNLLTFARKHTPVKQPVNMNAIIKKVLELRNYEQKVNNIVVNTNLASDLRQVMADYFQLQQVFLNIIINAEHFMIEANRGGILAIVTDEVGGYVRATFNDNGPGITQEVLGHVFDPFFTTKEVGKGTGLGLSICHGIVSEHGGRIYVESEPGKGASFIIELPASDGL